MIDDTKIEKLEHSAIKLTITVSADDTQKAYEKLLNKYRKEAQIPGFRKGKVPRDVLIRKFGEGIQHDAAAEIVDEAINETLKNGKESPISRPTLHELPPLNLGSPYVFTVTYDVFPEIVLGTYTNIEIEEPQVKILKKHEDAELELIREQNSIVVDKKDATISANSVVTMDYSELDADNAPLEKTQRKGFVFTVGKDAHPYGIEDEIMGMQVGEEKIIEKTYSDNADPVLANRSLKLSVSISTIKERQLPELDDELAQDVSEELKTIDDLRKKVKKDLQERSTARIRAQKMNTLTEKLLETTSIDLPESMIISDLEHTWREYIGQSGVTETVLINALKDNGQSKESLLDKWRDDAKKSIKTRLIYGKIVETEKIEISEDTLTAKIEERAVEYKMSPEELEKVFGGTQFREYLRNELVQEKLFDFLLNSASITKGEKIDYNVLIET